MLKIKNLSKKFNDKKILDNISVEVPKGSIAVFLGESGVGKSTLLRTLNNLETPDTGEVFLNDKKLILSDINKNHLVGMLFQQFNLFEHLTVKENITLALEKVANKSKKEASEIALNLLKKYGLEDKANTYVARISGGQKQRVAIARMIALKPQVVCLDEPTSALDPMLTNFVAQMIKELADEGYIVLIATHDTSILDKFPCMIYLMKDGKIVESAKSNEFFKNKENYPKIKNFVEGIN